MIIQKSLPFAFLYRLAALLVRDISLVQTCSKSTTAIAIALEPEFYL